MEPTPLRYVDYLRFEDERPFLLRAEMHELSDEERLRYAALVEPRDPARAEWLRLEVALHARAAEDPAVVARFVELGRRIGFEYAGVLLRQRIAQCGSEAAKREPPLVRFAFRCPKRWETLEPTEDPAVRTCQQCKEPVYRCDSVEDAEARARRGECIAVPRRLVERVASAEEDAVFGRPEPRDPLETWAKALYGGASVRVLSGGGEDALGRRFELRGGGETTVGRSASCTLTLSDPCLSRLHAAFERRGDEWWLRDLGTTHGSYVNDARVSEALLRDGDLLRLGETVLRFSETRPRAVKKPEG